MGNVFHIAVIVTTAVTTMQSVDAIKLKLIADEIGVKLLETNTNKCEIVAFQLNRKNTELFNYIYKSTDVCRLPSDPVTDVNTKMNALSFLMAIKHCKKDDAEFMGAVSLAKSSLIKLKSAVNTKIKSSDDCKTVLGDVVSYLDQLIRWLS